MSQLFAIFVTLACVFALNIAKAQPQEPGMFRAKAVTGVTENNLKIALGLDRGAVNLGAEYEARKGNSGYSGYVLLATEKLPVQKPQIMIFGAGMPIYVFDNRAAVVSITPGFGVNMIRFFNTNETTFGAQLRLSGSYRLSHNLRVGLEHMILTNWVNERAPGDFTLTQMLFTFSL